MRNDAWISTARGLELISSRFAATKKLDTVSARDEAKTAIIGALASGRLHSCPKGCLTSSFEAGDGRPSDFLFCELDADGNSTPILMNVQHEGEYVFVPPEFWANFRDPAAGASANWHDGHFSFRLSAPLQKSCVGEVRELCFDLASIERIGAMGGGALETEGTGDPGRPELGRSKYMREFERLIAAGKLEPSLKAQARVLHSWFCVQYPDRQAPKEGTIENRIRDVYNKAKHATK
ncbi:hypothetical protein ACT17R_02675 [Sphingopyxis sp. Q841]|uniref:hypothetical protein n=1 Tax=Sphingopyxis sp. Q841 TaxID=3458250 RepID=UPI00403752F9